MARNKKAGASPAEDIWADEHLAEAPAKTSAAVRLSDRWVRTIRRYTKLSVWAMPVIVILLLVIYSGMPTSATATKSATKDQINSAGKSAAILAEDEWLNATPAPLVGGQIIAWNGFSTEKKAKLDDAVSKVVQMPAYSIEIHHFTLTDSQGLEYESDIAIAVSPSQGTDALSTPSLTPIAPSASGWASTGTWYGLQTAQVPGAVTDAINGWASAFTSGSPTKLRLAVQDPKSSHSYVPLTGVSGVKTAVIAAGSRPVVNSSGQVSDAAPSTLIVQVQLTLTWKGQKASTASNTVTPSASSTAPPLTSSEDGTAAPTPTATSTPPTITTSPNVTTTDGSASSVVTYDLLVEKANTAAPIVVAWGGAGSGTTLTPYDQAVVHRSITGSN